MLIKVCDNPAAKVTPSIVGPFWEFVSGDIELITVALDGYK